VIRGSRHARAEPRCSSDFDHGNSIYVRKKCHLVGSLWIDSHLLPCQKLSNFNEKMLLILCMTGDWWAELSKVKRRMETPGPCFEVFLRWRGSNGENGRRYWWIHICGRPPIFFLRLSSVFCGRESNVNCKARPSYPAKYFFASTGSRRTSKMRENRELCWYSRQEDSVGV